MTSVIIRLQRLPWSATSQDVREFFKGLVIPEGGVHIVGGRDGDAFIAFGTDEDARQAMQMDNRRLKETRIKLLLSSRAEMQKVIEKARADYLKGSSPNDSAAATAPSTGVNRKRSRSREREPAKREKRSPSPARERISRHSHHSRSRSPVSERRSSRDVDNHLLSGNSQRAIAAATGIIPRNDKIVSGYQSFPASFAPPPDASGSMAPLGASQLPEKDTRTGAPLHADGGYIGMMAKEPLKDGYRGAKLGNNYANETDYRGSFASPVSQQSSLSKDRDTRFGRNGEFETQTGVARYGQISQQQNQKAMDHPEGAYIGKFDDRSNVSRDPNEGGFYRQATPDHSSSDRSAPFPRDVRGTVEQQQPKSGPRPFEGYNGSMASSSGGAAQRPSAVGFGTTAASFREVPAQESYSATFQTGAINVSSDTNKLDDSAFLHQPPPSRRTTREPLLKAAPPASMPSSAPPLQRPPFEGAPGPGFFPAPPQPLFFAPGRMPPPNSAGPFFDGSNQMMGPNMNQFGPGGARPPFTRFPPAKTCCLRVTQIPPDHRSYGALREFFEPLDLSGPHKIKMIYDESGSRTGLSYIRLREPGDVDVALRSNGRYGIRIEPCAEEEFAQAMDGLDAASASQSQRRRPEQSWDDGQRYRRTPPPRDANQCKSLERERDPALLTQMELQCFVVLLDNTPFSADDQDVKEFLRSANVRPLQAIKERCIERPSQFTGRIFVEVESEEAKNAVFTLNNQKLRVARRDVVRSCTVHDCSPAEMFRCTGIRPLGAKNFSPLSSAAPSRNLAETQKDDYGRARNSAAGRSACVYLTGLPYAATERDVLGLFSGSQVVPNGVHLMAEPRGSAYVELACFADADAALQKGQQYVGSRAVSMEMCTRDAMMSAIRRQSGSALLSPPLADDRSTTSFDAFKGAARSGLAPPVSGKRSLLENPVAPPHSFPKAPSSHSSSAIGAFPNPEGGLTLEQRGMPPSRMVLNPNDVVNVGKPGCVLAMHNLPPGISLEDLEHFLSNYCLQQDSVMMHYDNTGSPTGDCLVAVHSPEAAIRAAKELDGKLLQGRAVVVYVARVD